MRMAAAVLGVTCLLATGCAEVSSASRPPEAGMASPATARSCPTVVAGTLAGVAGRIYAQAAGGRNVLSATRRLQRSGALVAAVASGEPAATRRALSPLLEHQIRRIVIRRGPRVLARAGHGAALAPVTGVLRDRAGHAVGGYTLSVADDAAFVGITRALTGADVSAVAGGHVVAQAAGRSGGVPARVLVVRGRAFPRGPLSVRIGLPAGALRSCSGRAADVRADTIAVVGQRLLAGEASGPDARRVVRYVAADPGVRRAVAGDDPAALRAAIVRLFGVRALHVVRIRATTAGGALVNDVGGPYALAPISGPVLGPDGRRAGEVVVSVQDDAGYMKLAHRFTGAQVVLRGPDGVIPGSTLSVGAARLPARATMTVGGRRYRVRSFAARAFPDGPLWISLLVPA